MGSLHNPLLLIDKSYVSYESHQDAGVFISPDTTILSFFVLCRQQHKIPFKYLVKCSIIKPPPDYQE